MKFHKTKLIIFSICMACLCLSGVLLTLKFTAINVLASPGDLFVVPNGSGDCSQAAPCDLQTALGSASGGDTVYFASGEYTGNGSAVITVTESITLFGGWDGTPGGPVMRDPQVYTTILDGESQRRVIYISGVVTSPITASVDGFIITDGNATGLGGLGTNDAGGGVFVENASVTISNNVIEDNIASIGIASSYGGGIFLYGTSGNSLTANIDNNLISANTANPIYSGYGGGIFVSGVNQVTIQGNEVTNNTGGFPSNSHGGGISLYSTSAIVNGNLIQDNHASSNSEGFGGGLYSESGSLSMDGNTLISNEAEYGAVNIQYIGSFTLTNNILAQNPAGGLFVRGASTQPITGTLVNNTFADNDAAAIYAGWYSSGHSTLILTNTILAGNTTGIYAFNHNSPNVVTATHTLFYANGMDTIGDSITSLNEINDSDPGFLDPLNDNYHLEDGSPAIDAGLTVPWLTTDIDGNPRPWPVGGSCDIGADEAHWLRSYLPILLKIFE
jgi:hypothetical protein